MNNPSISFGRLDVDEVVSTQTLAGELLKQGQAPGLIVTQLQTGGRGRFGRTWLSEPGQSLCISLLFQDYADHPKPWLIGMSVAIAAAGAIKSQLQWPNDLTLEGRKVGGLLTEMLTDSSGKRIPVVGIGINLAQESFAQEIADRATSVKLSRNVVLEPEQVIKSICDRLVKLPEPDSWSSILPAWECFDDTPGKKYRLPDGKMAHALGIGPEGELIGSVDGETVSVMAAEAFF